MKFNLPDDITNIKKIKEVDQTELKSFYIKFNNDYTVGVFRGSGLNCNMEDPNSYVLYVLDSCSLPIPDFFDGCESDDCSLGFATYEEIID